MDVCGADKEFDNLFWSYVGPKNESTLEACRRCYTGLTNKITNPPRRTYRDEEMVRPGWTTNHFELRTSLNMNLHCVYIQKEGDASGDDDGCGFHDVDGEGEYAEKENVKTAEEKEKEGEGGDKDEDEEEKEEEEPGFKRNELIVIYVHTNTAACTDAMEVLPVCDALNACLVTYDLRGHGRSEGDGLHDMKTNLEDLEKVVAWARSKSNKMVLWARGAATCIATRYQSLLCQKVLTNPKVDNPVVYMVLDSPFISVRKMYEDGMGKVREKNYAYIPSNIFGLVAKYFRRAVKNKLKMDPFDVIVEPDMEHCTSPACFLIAINDDYIPANHGASLAALYGGPIFARMFEGRHFTDRAKEVVIGVVSHIESKVERD